MNLKEFSRTLGLSQTTVSRALNGYPEVNEATRLRVKSAAMAINYRPNIRAKSLATGRSMAIGNVIPISNKHEMLNPIFAEFLAGAGETYSSAGYDAVLSVVPENHEEQAYRDMASRGSVDGIIVQGPRWRDPRINLLKEIGLPFLVHGRASNSEQDFSWLDIDNRRSFQRAAQFLVDLGHRRIALLNGLEEMDFARRRREGFLATLEAAGITPDPGLMFSEEMTENFGYQTATNLLSQSNPPTAIITSSYITALGVQRAVHIMGLQIGKDVSVVTHDDDLSYLSNRGDVPVFTSTRSSVRAAGRRCAEILLEMIKTDGSPPIQELWETQLVVGLSTGPV